MAIITEDERLVDTSAPTEMPRAAALRVLMVTPRYWPFMGGVENHVYEVACRLVRRDVSVTVLTTDPSGQLPSAELLDGIKVRRVRAWPAQRDYYFAPEIIRLIEHDAWDLVHIQSYHTLVAPFGMLAARRAQVPYVVTFHGGGHSSRMRTALRGAQRTVLRPLLSHARRLIALAQFEIAFWSKQLHLPADRFVCIPNGADLPPFTRSTSQVDTDQKLIASVGRLERYKGHQRILAALPYILEECPNAQLWIAGVGPYEPSLRQLAKKLNVEEHVDIRAVPASERVRMAEELSQADLVVLLSEYETHPITVLEAVALGRPALVAANSGLSELAGRGWAKAIPLNSSPRQVADAVLQQLRQPLVPPRISLPTWDECADRLYALYQQVV
jgi:glycosyltransferase involved in cell wall biosynthesis